MVTLGEKGTKSEKGDSGENAAIGESAAPHNSHGTMHFKILVHKSMQREYEIKKRRTGAFLPLAAALSKLVKWRL